MMLKKNHFSLIIVVTLMLSGTLHAQGQEVAKKKNLENGTISEQFDYVIDNSNRYQTFKVIKKTWMYTLKSHVLDSLKSFHSEIEGLNNEIITKSNRIAELESSLSGVESNLSSVTSEKDNINFMGMALTKAKYKSMMWGIVGGLAALFLFFLMKFRSSNSITKSVKNDLVQLQDEYAAHKKTALGREQDLARKLQDEINKMN